MGLLGKQILCQYSCCLYRLLLLAIKWLRSMAPMTSVLPGFITTFTFSRNAHTYTHTHLHTHTHVHTDAVISRRLLKCNRLDRPEGTLVPRPTIPTCVCLCVRKTSESQKNEFSLQRRVFHFRISGAHKLKNRTKQTRLSFSTKLFSVLYHS